MDFEQLQKNFRAMQPQSASIVELVEKQAAALRAEFDSPAAVAYADRLAAAQLEAMGEECARVYAAEQAKYTKLRAEGGSLYAGEDILLVRYDAGDCDTCPWPMRSKKAEKNLRSALYDAREMGEVKNADRVILPNGKEFFISG